jgi:hypothetical protein
VSRESARSANFQARNKPDEVSTDFDYVIPNLFLRFIVKELV